MHRNKGKHFDINKRSLYHFSEKSNDSVAQLVEQYTFNVWVLGSNPSGITRVIEDNFPFVSADTFCIYKLRFDDSVAQLVEQYTFNVWVLGSNPSGITLSLQIIYLETFFVIKRHNSKVVLIINTTFEL